MKKMDKGGPKILRSTIAKIALAVILVLIGTRIILPFWIERYINRKIDGIVGFYGSVEDVDLSFIKNTYVVRNIRIIADSSKIKEPFFHAKSLLVTFHLADLFKGGIAGSGILFSPTLNYVQGKMPEDTQAPAEGKPFTDVLRNMVPFRVDIFRVKNGKVYYRNRLKSPDYEFYAVNIYGNIENLTNSRKLSSSMFTSAQFTAQAMDSGALEIDMQINPTSETPQFKLDGILKGLQLITMNDFLKSQTTLTFRSGVLDFTTELNSGGKRVKGYAVMDIQNLDMASVEELLKSDESLSKKFLEGLSEGAAELMEEDDRVRAKVIISTPVEEGKPDIIVTIVNAMRYAFVDAFISKIIPLGSL